MEVGLAALPATESQCRELACVLKDALAEVWRTVIDKAEGEGTPITAKLIRDNIPSECRPPKDGVPPGWNANEVGEKLQEVIRRAIARCPQEVLPHLPELLRAIAGELEIMQELEAKASDTTESARPSVEAMQKGRAEMAVKCQAVAEAIFKDAGV